jgi:hypothetical protein
MIFSKVIAFLLGLQLGYTKFYCFLCGWGEHEKVTTPPKNITTSIGVDSREKEIITSQSQANLE